jgi:hypothetical protein
VDHLTESATEAERAGLADIKRRANWIYGWPAAGIPILFIAGTLLGERSAAVVIV